MTAQTGRADAAARFGLLASALAGRALEVAAGAPGAPAWTDGRTIFVDPTSSTHERLAALTVQASLLAAGSLEPDVVRSLVWRPRVARRYLAIEGHRALAANERLLPRQTRSLVDATMAAHGDSPGASLTVALGRDEIPPSPGSFGIIRARRLVASPRPGDASAPARALPPLRDAVLAELDTDDVTSAVDLISSPVGAGGSLGRLLRRLLGAVRRLDASGPPGADAPTHRLRDGERRGGMAASSAGVAQHVDAAGLEARGTKYPEWDVRRRRYRPDWCTVLEVEPQPDADAPASAPDTAGLRRAFARLGLGVDRCHRQAQGDDLDIDAAVEARVEALARSAPHEAVYIDSVRRRRDLAVLLLLDVSGSAAEPAAMGQTVHVQQRAAAATLAVALHDLGERVALYAFRSQGRAAVHVMPVKRFDDALDTLVMRRLGGLQPGAFSRLGAAIRHGASVLERQGGRSRRLLVVLSDGFAYDHGYEPGYGAADARRALAETRRRGAACLCLSIGAGRDVDALRAVFGSAAHASIPRPHELRRVIGPLFRSALRSADLRRRLR